MTKITLSPNRYFLKDGKPFFYLADTAWCAFQHLSTEEFRRYAETRVAQGFTVVQISALPLSFGSGKWHPFAKRGESYDYSSINIEYFDHAVEILKTALGLGLLPCVHLLWVDYVPDTWGASRPIPEDLLEPLLKVMLGRFAPYSPFFSVTGDTRFETPRVIRYYRTALDLISGIAPDAQTTMHINPDCFPPKELTDHRAYTFATYQSGHGDSDWIWRIDGFSKSFAEKLPEYPLINNEPCYEDIGHYLNKAERFTAKDVRHAAWRSILGGASAGITYGAHGIWQCRLPGYPMFGEETWGESTDIFTALDFPGAKSVCELRRIFEAEDLFGLRPTEIAGDHITAVDARGKRKITYFPDKAVIPDGAKVWRFEDDALIIR